MLDKRGDRGNRALVSAVLSLLLAFAVISGCGKKAEFRYGPGGKWIDDMRERITKEIDDPDKSIRLLEQVDRIETVLIELDDTLLEHYDRLAVLDADYKSKREDFQKEIDSFNDYRNEALDTLVGIILEMKNIAGRADWESISDIDETLYESWQRSFGS